MEDSTRKFTALDSKAEMREILSSVYNSLMVKGYNPINQIVGYILSEDPTYITNYNSARTLITRLDRDELLQELLKSYLEKKSGNLENRLSGRILTGNSPRFFEKSDANSQEAASLHRIFSRDGAQSSGNINSSAS